MNFKSVFIIFLLVFMGSLAFAQTSLQIAEDFTIKDTQGQVHDLFTYLDNDKIVVISFSTTG